MASDAVQRLAQFGQVAAADDQALLQAADAHAVLAGGHHFEAFEVVQRQQRVAVDVTGVASFAWRFLITGRWYVVAAAVPTPLNANSAWSPPDRLLVR